MKQSPVDLTQLQATVTGLPVDIVCKLLRYVMPCVSANAAGGVSDAIRTGDIAAAIERMKLFGTTKDMEEFDDTRPESRRSGDKPKRRQTPETVAPKPSSNGAKNDAERRDPGKRRRAELLTRAVRQRQ